MELPPPSSPLPLKCGAFGKLPKVGDFVRAGLSNEATRAFEEWLHQGVQYGHDKRGAKWKPQFLSGATYAFVYRATLGTGDRAALLSGIMKPSQDSVGRAFPLTIYGLLPDGLPAPLAPEALGGFLDGAVEVSTRAADLSSGASLDADLLSLAGVEDWRQMAATYQRWVTTTSVSTLWQWIFGDNDPMRLTYALYTLLEIARPLRTRPQPQTPLGIRFPLGRLGGAAAAFWLDLVTRAMGWRHHVPTFFWFFDGYRGDLMVQLGRTPASSFVELWWPDARNESMSDLVSLPPWRDARSHLPPRVLECLDRPQSSTLDLLNAVGY